MNILPSVLEIWILLVFLATFFSLSHSYDVYSSSSRDDPSVTYKYDRIDELKKECGSLLKLASELKPDDYRKNNVTNKLSFVNGDWEQEADGSPLIPFDDGDMPKSSSGFQSPLKLVSFWITDIDKEHSVKNAVVVSGMLYLGITRNGSFAYKPYGGSPQFQIRPGNTQLIILFQGLYIESSEGERMMCLLGSSTLPSRQPDSTDPWEWVKGSGSNYYQPPLLQDDQIKLVLRYPKTFTLSSREITGEMKSLNQKSNLKYFDNIHISSQFSAYVDYKFGSQLLVSKACSPYPYQDDLMNSGIDIYKGSRFCGILERFTSAEAFNVVPMWNWKCNKSDEYCSNVGPFTYGKNTEAINRDFNSVRLIMQDLRCEPKYAGRNLSSARVSAVFRAVPPFENRFIAVERTGLSNMTLLAEGIWNSSSGQLCMVGCTGSVGTEPDNCNSRICLYVPLSFSITQRSIIYGSISSIDNSSSSSFFPLPFERVMKPSELWDQFSTSYLSYKYTKVELAGAFLERSEPFDFRSVIKKSFLSYPTVEDGPSYLDSLSVLLEDLILQVPAIADNSPKVHPNWNSIDMELISLGPLFGRLWYSKNTSTIEGKTAFHAKTESTEKQLLLNVSAQLTLEGKSYSNISMFFLEGIYDSRVGKMYLIGCRDVRTSWKILFESSDLEGGLDCLIEVKLEYPPKTARWLTSPTAKISISSQRNDDDPLHFSPINLQTFPILYRKQREDILSRRGVEGILRILTLSLAISCILSQLLYIREKIDDVPYISIVMLGVQALGYSLPLITGAEALFKRLSSEPDEPASYSLEKNQWVHAIDYTVKLLVLAAFLLTLRLCQKVWKSRIRLLTRAPLEPGRVPSDRRVLYVSLVIHTVGFILVFIAHTVNVSKRPVQQQRYIDSKGNSYTMRDWEIELEEYLGLVQDFFLLPQIIGNILWQIQCKPLRKFYYAGVTLVRLLPHVYDYMRTPVFNPYFSEEYEFVNPNQDFYSRFGDIAIPVTSIVLALVVYVQQRWSYQKLSQTINTRRKLLPLGSKVYERLPSVSFEAELVSGVNETVTHARHQVNEE